jgi:two-component system, OmpR family, alkaline phosphatase synthesis response regulator PhoP
MEKEAYRILAVDDDPDILELLKYNFEKEGFKVKTIEESSKAVEAAVKFKPDLIILDIMMYPINGIEICKRLRELSLFQDTYIFFLTARSENYYQDAALDTGGDDFIEKIIGLRALANKVITVLRGNYVIRKSARAVVAGDLVIDRRGGALLRGEPLQLSKIELELLFFLAQNPKKVITEENLINNIWGSDTYSTTSSPQLFLETLMRKLGKHWIEYLGNGKYRFLPYVK